MKVGTKGSPAAGSVPPPAAVVVGVVVVGLAVEEGDGLTAVIDADESTEKFPLSNHMRQTTQVPAAIAPCAEPEFTATVEPYSKVRGLAPSLMYDGPAFSDIRRYVADPGLSLEEQVWGEG